jgi:phosphatidylglycerophosphate synthase
MRKISDTIEGPIDNVIIDWASHFSAHYKELGYTPNILTTYSLFFGCVSAYFFYNSYNTIAVILFMLAYYFDCADGFFARKYNLATEFGDMYDHISDVSKLLLIFTIMYYKDSNKFISFSPIIFITFALSLIHLGCQETIYEKNESPSLKQLTHICVSDPEKIMPYTRYFSTGTFIAVVAIFMFSF